MSSQEGEEHVWGEEDEREREKDRRRLFGLFEKERERKKKNWESDKLAFSIANLIKLPASLTLATLCFFSRLLPVAISPFNLGG